MNLQGMLMAMVKAGDNAGNGEVTLRKSTLLVIGLVPAFLVLIVQVGSPVASWLRSDEAKAMQIIQLQHDVESMTKKIDAQTSDISSIKQSMVELQKVKDSKK